MSNQGYIDSKVKSNLVMLVLWWSKQGFSTSPNEPLLPVHGIVQSSNLGSSKLLAAIQSERCFYFVQEVVRMGVAGDTKCKSPIAFSQYSHAYLRNIVFEDYTCILVGCMKVHNEWKFLSFTPHPFFVPKLVGNIIEQDPIVALFPPSLQLISLTGHPVWRLYLVQLTTVQTSWSEWTVMPFKALYHFV